MASLYRLDVIIRGNSDITEIDAIKWTKNWVNKRQEKSDNKNPDGSYKREYYADLFDSRSKKLFKIFSDVATKNRNISNTYNNIKGVISVLGSSNENNSSYISKGEVIINTENGTKRIEVNNNNAQIFLQVEDSLKAIARVENQNENGFDIVLYDGEYFDEDRVKLDCSDNPIKVNYLVI